MARLPKSRTDFWTSKLEENHERDKRNVEALIAMGWRVLIVWECELKDTEALANKLRCFLNGR